MYELNKTDIFTTAQYADNAQDGIVMLLAYEQMTLEQIRNLKIEDVEKVSLKFKLDPITLKVIRNAIDEKGYVDESEIHYFNKSEYVVKGIEEGPVSEDELIRRIKRLFSRWGLDELSIEDVQQCGLDSKE